MTTKARRKRGEGSIFKRADGRWVATVALGGGARKCYYGPDQKTVQAKLRSALADMRNGLQPGDERLTMAAFASQWIIAVESTVKPRTFEHYRDLLERHILPTLGPLNLRRMAPADVRQLMQAKLADGLSPRTVGHIRAVLRRVLNDALREELITRNVAALVTPPRVPRREVHAVTPSEAIAVFDAVRTDRMGPLFVTALATGARQGELLGLRWSEVDLDARTVRINQTVGRIKGRAFYGEPKTSGSGRTFQIPDLVVAALREQRRSQAEDRLLAGGRWQDACLVFATSIGTPLDGGRVTRRLQQVLAAAGLPRMRFHDLRHLVATVLLAKGVPMRVVMELLGHSSISVTANTYSHVSPALQREAADVMDRVLSAIS